MYYIIYEVKNKTNGKSYIGKHQTDNIYDDYLGSGKYLKRALNKYGPECFEKIILFIFDNKIDMDNKEAELVTDEFVKSKETYNLKLGGEGGFDHLNTGSPEHIERCKRARIETNKVLEIKYGKNWYSLLGIKNNLNNWKKSNDPEIKKRRSEISGNAFRGKHHTEETKEKMSKLRKDKYKGKDNPNFHKIWIYSLQEKRSISIKKEELNFYLSNGWIKGRKITF